MSALPLQGKTALITGSTQGLGLATAKQFAAAGCRIIDNGLQGGNYIGADLRDPAQIETMIQAAGPIDILVNNAVVRHTAPIERFAPENWDESISVNLSAAFHTIRLALPAMKSRGWGRIVNVSSIYGQRGAANRVGYVTTKTALIGLTRTVALEVVGTGVTCNAVCPGTTETPVHEATIESMMKREGLSRADAEKRFLTGKQPTGKIIAVDDVAAMIVYLCGASSGDINGSVFPIDAGWSAG
ncbi:MAG TPA: SDR family NAD(P)-dependent oxidoreductase [Vicinamibacterales bacterium]|nr:SDR family NAD(P)-dependent oxidoreductase [Vicinamibacterales bacterium]